MLKKSIFVPNENNKMFLRKTYEINNCKRESI